jgi:hypothetical protein
MTPVPDFQRALVAYLKAAPSITALVGTRVVDGPRATTKAPFISIGTAQVIPDDYDRITADQVFMQLDVWVEEPLNWKAHEICGAVKAVLHDVYLDLEQHALAKLLVDSMQVVDDPDGITKHGIIQLSALIEEREP